MVAVRLKAATKLKCEFFFFFRAESQEGEGGEIGPLWQVFQGRR